MKGPGMRLDLDVRRIWKCPQCGREVKSDGDMVSRRCNCRDGGVWMQLIERRPPARVPQPSTPAAVSTPAVDRDDDKKELSEETASRKTEVSATSQETAATEDSARNKGQSVLPSTDQDEAAATATSAGETESASNTADSGESKVANEPGLSNESATSIGEQDTRRRNAPGSQTTDSDNGVERKQ